MSDLESRLYGGCPLLIFGSFPCALTPSIYLPLPPLSPPPFLLALSLQGVEPSWAEAKRQLGDTFFLRSLHNFDKEAISDRVLKKIGQYVAQPDFQVSLSKLGHGLVGCLMRYSFFLH